jgi:hypothetical protein
MDQATLVVPDIESARAALHALDIAGIESIVALLVVLPEYEDWRLMLSSPSLDQDRPLIAHDRVSEVLRGEFVYTLPPIMILPVADPFFNDLRKAIGGRINAGTRLRVSLEGLTIGNRYIVAGYLLRFPGVMV